MGASTTSACSKPCGGGIAYTTSVCQSYVQYSSPKQILGVVNDQLCDPNLRPAPEASCNSNPCPLACEATATGCLTGLVSYMAYTDMPQVEQACNGNVTASAGLYPPSNLLLKGGCYRRKPGMDQVSIKVSGMWDKRTRNYKGLAMDGFQSKTCEGTGTYVDTLLDNITSGVCKA